MSVISMTGFGRGTAQESGVRVTVELGTVNRKQFDCTLSMPRPLACLESKLQTMIHAAVERGHVKGNVELTSAAGGGGLELDEARAVHAVAAVRRLARKLGLADDLSAGDLLRIPELMRAPVSAHDPLALWPLIEQGTARALERLKTMRRREGAALARDLRRRLGALRQTARALSRRAPCVPANALRAFETRLKALAPTQDVDPARLARELALLADRCDVSEELTRLESHFDQAELFLSGDAPCGRSLDFLCQELFREINTIGAKANDAVMTRLVVRFKTELEAVREQVQNVA